MEFCKTGKYERFFNVGETGIVAFISDVESDYKALKALNKVGSQCLNYRKNSDYNYRFDALNSVQDVPTIGKDTIELNEFLFQFYNIYGQSVKEPIRFTMTNEYIQVGERKYKLEERYNCEYIHKCLKTKIVTNSIEKLRKHIIDAMHCDSPFNCQFYNVLEYLKNQ